MLPTSLPDCDLSLPPPGAAPRADGPRMMVAEVVPVWQRHVEASRLAVEQGIGELLESFSHLCDGVMQISRQPLSMHQTQARTTLEPDHILTRLLDSADVNHQRREQLLGQLAESLVQLDAIEATLHGSLPDGATLLQQLDDRRTALSDLARQVAADIRQDHARQDQALAEARQSLRTQITKDLERVLLGMQFQDRINQTLTNVARDMQRFTEWMRDNEHASHTDAKRWLAELERSYTMQEQRSRHRGQPDLPAQGGSVEFF